MTHKAALWTSLLEHIANIGAIAAFIGIVLAGYQVWVPQSVIERNHLRVTAMVHWASRGSWLFMMQAGVRWVLGLMQKLYGPPHQGRGALLIDYMTVRAWKMSAWIATFLLLVVPPLVLSVAIPVSEYYSGNRVPWELFPILGGISLVLAIPFFLTWRLIRHNDEFTDHTGVESVLRATVAVVAEGTKVSTVIAISVLIATPLLLMIPRGSILEGAVFISVAGITVLALLTSLIRSIRRHGFFAPAAFVLILMVTAVYCFELIGIMISIFDKTSPPDKYYLVMVPAFVLSMLNARDVFSKRGQIDEVLISKRFAWIVAIMMVTIFLSLNVGVSEFSNQIFRFLIMLIFIVLTPYVLSIYAAIYSNAVPDWFSVALTRSVLFLAAQTHNVGTFFMLLFFDFICVILFCILTGAILISAFTASALMISVAGEYSGINGTDAPARFFLGGLQVPRFLFEVLSGRSEGSLTGLASETQSGTIIVVTLVTLSLTSLIPTILNAITIIALILARVIAVITMPMFTFLHELLVIENNTTPDEQRIKLVRSAVLIASFVSFFYFAVYTIFWLVETPVKPKVS